jgi:prepilin-type N-terminal cleavage/methylation domain-containing protein
MPSARHSKGFTLIELLVVIAIIALLTVIALTIYTSVGAKSRDSKRKEDLRAIAQALEIFYQKNQGYPATSGWVKSNAASPWISSLTTEYIESMPLDPKVNNGGDPRVDNGYGYAYWADTTSGGSCPGIAGQFYILITQLENKSDSERNEVRDYKSCDGSGGSAGWSKFSYVLTSPD